MLKSLLIKNFKKFEKLDLHEFSRVNIFVGNNNSGKSTILEAIEICSANDFYNSLQRSLRIRNIDESRTVMRRMMPVRQRFDLLGNVEDFLFHDTKLKQATFAVTGNKILPDTVISIGVGNNINTGQIDLISDQSMRENNLIKRSVNYKVTTHGNLRNESSIMVDNDNGLMSTRIKQPYRIGDVIYFQTKDMSVVGSMYSNLVKNKKKNQLIEKLQIFDKNIMNIELINEDFSVDVGKDVLLPINYLGSGIVSLIYLIIYMLNAEDGILLIDELENGIYYKKLVDLVKTIDSLSEELNVQLFITTHSDDLIRNLGNFNELSLYRLNPKFNGGVMRWDRTKIIQYVDDNSADIR